MRKSLTFIAGMGVGALLLYLILYMVGIQTENSEKERLRQQLYNKLSEELTDMNRKPEIQYIEVKGRKGIVTLHTGMSKDSVKILLGKPDEIDLRRSLNSNYENWGYKIKNRYLADLTVDFVNGKMDGVSQD